MAVTNKQQLVPVPPLVGNPLVQWIHQLSQQQQQLPSQLPIDSKRTLELLFTKYKSRLLNLSNKMRKLSSFKPMEYNGFHESLKFTTDSPPTKLQLGDKVKISMTKRQFKQYHVHSWNELVTKDFHAVGTVTRICENGENEAVVHFSKSGHVWVISRRCLVKSQSETDEENGITNPRLKVGDSVMIPHEDKVVREMNLARSGLPEEIIRVRKNLDEVLCFDGEGGAFVSFFPYGSRLINSALLVKRPEDQPFVELETLERIEVSKKYPMDWYVSLYDNNTLLQDPTWNYKLTKESVQQRDAKVLGCDRSIETLKLIGCNDVRIRYHGYNGLLGVSRDSDPNGEIHLIHQNLIEKSTKSRVQQPSTHHKSVNRRKNRSKGNESSTTKHNGKQVNPLPVDNWEDANVTLALTGEHVLHDLRIHPAFLMVLLKTGKILGFQNKSTAIVELHGEILQLPIHILGSYDATNGPYQVFKEQAKATRELKVGDAVILDVGPFPLALDLLEETYCSKDILKAMTSRATLMAFNDDSDEAILKYDVSTFFAVPADFVTATNVYLEDLRSRTRHNSAHTNLQQAFNNADIANGGRLEAQPSAEEMQLVSTIAKHVKEQMQGKCNVTRLSRKNGILTSVYKVTNQQKGATIHELSDSFTETSTADKSIECLVNDDKLEFVQDEFKVNAIILIAGSNLPQPLTTDQSTHLRQTTVAPMAEESVAAESDDLSSDRLEDTSDAHENENTYEAAEDLQEGIRRETASLEEDLLTDRNLSLHMNIPPFLKAVHYNQRRREIVIKCDRLVETSTSTATGQSSSARQSDGFDEFSLEMNKKLSEQYNSKPNNISNYFNMTKCTFNDCKLGGV